MPAFLGENGDELHFKKDEGILTVVGQGDMVFTDEKSKQLWEISQMPTEFLMEKFEVPGIPPKTATPMTLPIPASIIENSQYSSGDVNININDLNLPNVTNYREFRDSLIKDRTFEKAVECMSIEKFNKNYNSLSKYKYVGRR